MGGHSQVISATGEALAMAGVGEEVLSVDVDLDAVSTWREQFPVLADRRLH
jgi:predicted amidohydrolase